MKWALGLTVAVVSGCGEQQAPSIQAQAEVASSRAALFDSPGGGVFPARNQPRTLTSKGGGPAELGMRLKAREDGLVSRVHFFEGPQEEGPYTASVWSADGQLLGRVQVPESKGPGWRTGELQTPVAFLAGETYVVSRGSPQGRHPVTEGGFRDSGLESATLVAPKDGEGGPNGVRAGVPGTFPTAPAGGDTFFVDVSFARADVRPPALAVHTPAEGAVVSGVVEVTGVATDASGVERVEVQVDDGPLVAVQGNNPFGLTWDSAAVADGSHALTVVATDTTGKQSRVVRTVTTFNTPRIVLAQPLGLSADRVVDEEPVTATVGWTNEGGGPGRLAQAVVAAWAPGADLSGAPTLLFAPALQGVVVRPGETVGLSASLSFSHFQPLGTWQVAAGVQDAEGEWTWGPSQSVTRVHAVALGTAVNNGRLFDVNEPLYQDTFLAHFDGFTPEYEMKWAQVQPRQGVFDFALTDRLVDFAEQNGKRVRGHTLVWYKSLPAWVTDRTWTREEAIALLEGHITEVVGHYRGRIREWDVVNEALNSDGTWRKSVWLDAIGPDYVEIAFRAAHAADPDARLYYNDYDAERVNAKSTAMLNLLSGLKAKGVPVHGVGFQSHVSFNYFPSRAQLEENLARFHAAGLLTQVTELDVKTSALSGTVAQKWEKQAEVYRGIAEACQATPSCVRVSTWGSTDRYTWLGTAEMPLPFDSAYVPKPAFFALAEALQRHEVPPAPVAAPTGERLGALGAPYGLKVGTVAKNSAIRLNTDFRATLAREFNLVTPEFEMKMATVQPARGVFTFAAGKQLVQFAKGAGLSVHGHTLVWHKSLPAWVAEVPVSEREAVLREHVERTVAAFAGNVLVWDVVNEAFNDDGTYRSSVWLEAMGEGYIARAFEWARSKDAGAKLIYNDYGIEVVNSKSTAVYNMVKALRAAGVPIQGVGFQAHLSQRGLDWRSFADNLARFADLGVELYITELDVALDSTTPTPEDLAAQAAVYRAVLDTVLFQPAVKAFQMWGHTDAYSWKAAQAPLLLDTSFQPKPAYQAVQSRLTDGGFTGNYRLVAKSSQKVMSVQGASLANAARIVQAADTSAASQRWQLQHLGAGIYYLVNVNSGRAVKTVNGATTAGALLEQYDVSGFASQKWRPLYVGGGYYKLVNATSGLNIRVQAGSLAEGAALDMASYTGADNHKWRIEARP